MSHYTCGPSTASLDLYCDTVTRDTGRYFCQYRSFSLPRTGNKVSILQSGEEVLGRIHKAMLSAQSFIWIADWQMACDVELAERNHPDHPGRLHNVIRSIISTKPVHIRIILYGSPLDSAVGTYDGLVRRRIMALNNDNYPGTVRVWLQQSTSEQPDAMDYSHHQKFVVVDGRLGYIGGIDLSYGRWETPNFDVVVDPARFVINEMYNPCKIKPRGLTTREKEKISAFGFEHPYGGLLIEEGCQPRMPWQDVHIEIAGPSVVDIHRNFVRRWNSRAGILDPGLPRNWGLEPITRKWLESIGGWPRLQSCQLHRSGGAQVQILRSVSRKHLKIEGTEPEDLDLYAAKERDMWKRSLTGWRGEHQSNILDAMINCIRSADNYIYIETQFFISQFGTRDRWGGTKHGNENKGIENHVVEELANRINHHICAKGNPPFHVYLVLPVCPEGNLADEPTWKQHWLALSSIKHGGNSLIQRIKESLRKNYRNEDEWVQYLTVLNMRSYGATVSYARDPKTFDEDFSREIGRYVITEQVYIHSKLLIVDDAVAIIGSANTNDRSLTGNGDTEIAAIVVDTEGVELRDLGSPNFKVQTRKFARELRIQLWEKHFGFRVAPADSNTQAYFLATDRAKRGEKAVLEALPYPPRTPTTPKRIQEGTKVPWSEIRDKPCSPETIRAIRQIALVNSSVYDHVFRHTPRNEIATFQESVEISLATPPYAAAYRHKDILNNRDVKPSDYPDEYRGVLPPALQSNFMTDRMFTHQRVALNDSSLARRQQTYEDLKIHDVKKAIEYLQKYIVGFFVLAPLDWGKDQRISEDPTKATSINADIANNQLPERQHGEHV